MVDIPSGEFIMGSRGYGAVEEFDEAPAHLVRISRPFRISATEITNIQYEQYDPSHRKLRGKAGFSTKDNDAVIFVSYNDALGFAAGFLRRREKLQTPDRSGMGIRLPRDEHYSIQYWHQWPTDQTA